MKIIKILAITIIVTLLLIVITPELYYAYKVNDLNPSAEPSTIQYPTNAQRALWTDLEGNKNIELEPFSATSFTYLLLKAFLLGERHDQVDFPLGRGVADQVGRQILIKRKIRFGSLERIVIGIWASKKYTADEALNYLLDNMYFGFGNHGLNEAASFYFGKQVSELTPSETISLIATLRAPAAINPYCRQEDLTQWARKLAGKMATSWPGEYDADYSLPTSKKRTQITCR